MRKDITMQSVFFDGFKAAYKLHLDWCCSVKDEPSGETYFDNRNKAWEHYVQALEEELKSGK